MSNNNERRIKTTYQVVTLESAKEGDYADQGWEDEIGVFVDPIADMSDFIGSECITADGCAVPESELEFKATVYLACKFLRDAGPLEPSNSPQWSEGTWYTGPHDVDYSGGSETTYSYHMSGFSEEEEKAIYDSLKLLGYLL